MAGINWNPQQMQQVSFNPNQGLAVANSAFKNITDTVSAQQEAQSLAAYRQANQEMAERQQSFREGEPERLRAEQERLAKVEQDKLRYAEEFGYGLGKQGAERLDDIGPILSQSVPGWNQMTPEQQHEAKVNHISNNTGAALGADPKLFAKRYRQGLLESGQNFTKEEINLHLKDQMSRNFPTMDPETFKIMMQYGPGKEKGTSINVSSDGSVSRGNNSGSVKSVIPQLSTSGIKDIAIRIGENRGLPKTPGTLWFTDVRTDWGDNDPAYTDIEKAVSYLTSQGITSETAIDRAINSAFGVNGKTLKKELNFIKKDGREALLEIAKQNQDHERQLMTKNGKLLSNSEGDSESVAENNRYRMMDKLLSATAPKKLSDEELAQQFLQSTFGDDAELGVQTPDETVPAPKPDSGKVLPQPVPTDPNSTDPILANMVTNPNITNPQLVEETRRFPTDKLLPPGELPQTGPERLFSSLAEGTKSAANNAMGLVEAGVGIPMAKLAESNLKTRGKIFQSRDKVFGQIDKNTVPSREDVLMALKKGGEYLKPDEEIFLKKLLLNLNRGIVKEGDKL